MSGVSENIKVVIRIRPLNKSEIEQNVQKCVQINKRINQICLFKGTLSKPYYFDYIFDENDSQHDVYSFMVSSIVEEVFLGYNGTVLAYGQTGSGKTYTISGKRQPPHYRGLLPITFEHIFSKISQSQGKFLVNVTYLEIYNDEVFDLLVHKENKLQTGSLEIRERPEIGVYVDKLSGYVVESLEDVDKLLLLGNKNRVTAFTDMNSESSRSHTIFTITIESISKDEQDVKFGKLTFVDLAGSERQKKSNTTGIRFKEATKINLALSVLSNVISILADGKSNFVPYRSSKLTRLLQDSLGGNSKTVMIATISASENDYNETCSTLRYANRTKSIKNCVFKNSVQKDSLLKQFQDEIAELKRQLANLNTDDEDEDDNGDAIEDISQYEENKYNQTKLDHNQLSEQLKNLNSKVLIGGENLFEKVKKQEHLLKKAKAEIEDIEKSEQELAQSLRQKEIERLKIEETYSCLQEELAVKREKLRSIMKLTNSALMECEQIENSNRKEIEELDDHIACINEAVVEADQLIKKHIPNEFLDKIIANCEWNQDLNEWQLRAVAYTGNNIKKQLNLNKDHDKSDKFFSNVYESYSKLTNVNRDKSKESFSFIPKRKIKTIRN